MLGPMKNDPETIAVEPITGEDAKRLILALDEETSIRYPNPEDNFFELDEGEVAPGRGAFLIARCAGRAVGCGAVRLFDADTAEIKRMYVSPEARRRGLGGRILSVLEAEALRLGASRLVLETGERQPEAIAVYTRAGFVRIPCFGEYAEAPQSVCFGKALRPDARSR